MKTLSAIWQRLADAGYETDKNSVHSYIPIYEEILAPYRETAKNVLEIGIFRGHSLLMWEQYFTNAEVRGIDCDEQPHGGMADLRPMIAEGTHNIHIMDGTDIIAIEKEFGDTKFDVVIDDGNHQTTDQIKSFLSFKNRMNKGGVYLIEDPQELDKDKETYLSMHDDVQIFDLRDVKGRYDDAIILIRF